MPQSDQTLAKPIKRVLTTEIVTDATGQTTQIKNVSINKRVRLLNQPFNDPNPEINKKTQRIIQGKIRTPHLRVTKRINKTKKVTSEQLTYAKHIKMQE